MSAHTVTKFSGHVACRFDGCGPLGLILSGHTALHPTEPVSVAFAGDAPAGFPHTLQNAAVESIGPASFRISGDDGSWNITARAVHVHREIAAAFFAAVPSRPLRWTQRLFWRLVFILAASSAGRSVLRIVRGG